MWLAYRTHGLIYSSLTANQPGMAVLKGLIKDFAACLAKEK